MEKTPKIIKMDMKEMRRLHGISLKALSIKLDVSRPTLINMEKNKEIPMEYYKKFHEILPHLFPL